MTVADFSLNGKVAIVTGGSRGIGRSIAVALAEAGADVCVAARKPEALEETLAAIKPTGRKAIAVPTNVRDVAALQHLVDETKAQLGRIDILVNNAATNPVFGPVANLDERAWDAIANTNVKSAFFLSKKMVREAIREHGQGWIDHQCELNGRARASTGLGGYSVSKAALIMLTQVCAKEWGTDGIRVNAIAPGLIKTEFSRALWENEAILKNSLTQSPLRRIGDPDEMAGAVVYFASAASSFTTGQTLVLDGGGLA
ncbi:MAG: glucose 1-dehydrogenase [Dehalococcoidia bacterium]|nr:glucose 1-dehydrogenase [Dehalococcoidia bacterium]